MGRINNTIVQNQVYSFCIDYETLWMLMPSVPTLLELAQKKRRHYPINN